MHMINKKFFAKFWLFSFLASFVALSYAEVRDNGFQFQAEWAMQQADAKNYKCAP